MLKLNSLVVSSIVYVKLFVLIIKSNDIILFVIVECALIRRGILDCRNYAVFNVGSIGSVHYIRNSVLGKLNLLNYGLGLAFALGLFLLLAAAGSKKQRRRKKERHQK